MRELGKAGKYNGDMHPRDLRRLDPAPPMAKVPGKAGSRRPKLKRFGFSYQSKPAWGKNWSRKQHWSWYHTVKQRDQAMLEFPKHWKSIMEVRNLTPIDRASGQESVD